MRRGCITRAIFFLVILAGIVIYIVGKYGPIVEESIKNETINFAQKNILNEIEKAERSLLSDSLRVLVGNYLERLSLETKDEVKTKADSITADIKTVLEDSKIDPTEFEKLYEKLKLE